MCTTALGTEVPPVSLPDDMPYAVETSLFFGNGILVKVAERRMKKTV